MFVQRFEPQGRHFANFHYYYHKSETARCVCQQFIIWSKCRLCSADGWTPPDRILSACFNIWSVSNRWRHKNIHLCHHAFKFLSACFRIKNHYQYLTAVIVQELCESRGGRPGLSVLTSLLVSVDVKIYCTVLRHWSQLVPNMSHDIWGH